MKWYLAHQGDRELWLNTTHLTAICVSPADATKVRLYFIGEEDHLDINGPIEDLMAEILPE
jgi:hypothetical protein